MRVVMPHAGMQCSSGRILSPPPSATSRASNSSDNFSYPQLEVVSEETVRQDSVFRPSALEESWGPTSNLNPAGERRVSGGVGGGGGTGDGSGSGGSDDGGGVYRSPSRKDGRLAASLSSGPRLPHPLSSSHSLSSHSPSSSSPLHPYSAHAHHLQQRQMLSDELGVKPVSPYCMSEDGEGPLWEVWVASSNAHHSTLSVIDYAQSFFAIEVCTYIDTCAWCRHMCRHVDTYAWVWAYVLAM